MDLVLHVQKVDPIAATKRFTNIVTGTLCAHSSIT